MEQIGTPRLEFSSVDSTMDIGREHALRGAPHGTLITATHQSAGRGRRGAKWHDETGASALMTFVLRPDIEIDQAWRLSFIASLACVKYVRSIGIPDAQVKWPNDLVIDGRKVGGMLLEACGTASPKNVFLIGIGINVFQTEFDDESEYILPPTSLQIAFGSIEVCPNARQVIDGIASSLDQVYSEHIQSGPSLIELWRQYQLVGHAQTGVDIDTGETINGIYRDVRWLDGAGLIDLPNGMSVAIMPTAA